MSECILSKDILYDCEHKPVKGSRSRIIVIAHEDISNVDYNTSNNTIVEDITLASGKRAFEYTGNGMPLAPTKTLAKDDSGMSKWIHGVPFVFEGNTPDIKAELNIAGDTPVTIIVENRYKGDSTGKSKYEILGLESPLYLEECADDGGNMRYVSVFKNKDEYPSSTLPHNFFITDLSTTALAIDALLEATS
jgi:hypothetical protein